MTSLHLPTLKRLQALLAPGPMDASDASSLSTPHERAIAQAMGWPVRDGRMPFAADCASLQGAEQTSDLASGPSPGQAETGWAFVTPCHWQMGQDHVRMLDPGSLQLSGEHAQLLRRAMLPYFAEDGIHLQDTCLPGAMGQPAALSWLAEGELFGAMACASLDRVSGRELSDWMPEGPGAKVVRRLQSEMQMLLYTHPVNDARQQLGLLPVNSFWVSGCGALPARSSTHWPRDGMLDASLRQAALADDAPAYALAWQQLDAGPVQRLQAALRQGASVQLTLCGERNSVTWNGPARGIGAKTAQWLRAMRGPSLANVLESL